MNEIVDKLEHHIIKPVVEKKPLTKQEIEKGVTDAIEEVFPELTGRQKAMAVQGAMKMVIESLKKKGKK